jgi:hypothetical protein
MDANGQISQLFTEKAKAAGATPEKPQRVLEIWGFARSRLARTDTTA